MNEQSKRKDRNEKFLLYKYVSRKSKIGQIVLTLNRRFTVETIPFLIKSEYSELFTLGFAQNGGTLKSHVVEYLSLIFQSFATR